MKTTHRNYDETRGDFKRLARFIVDNNEDVRAYSTWCIGRFVDWKYGMYENRTAVPDFWARNAHLWFDGFERLAGFVISENGGADFAVITLAGYRFLFEDMLAWALVNWADREPTPAIEITARQTREMAILDAHGFSRKANFFRETFDLSRELPQREQLPEGFSIVDMAVQPDYPAQRIMRTEAFDGKSELSDARLRHELLFYNHGQQGPIYHPQTDLCVMAADGRFVAGCEALIDSRNGAADIERVCTHSSFRRRGFARAVILECLYRLQEMGLRRAYITGYSPAAVGLYASFGSSERRTFYIYEETSAAGYG